MVIKFFIQCQLERKSEGVNTYEGIINATIAAGPTHISAEVPRIAYIKTGTNEE